MVIFTGGSWGVGEWRSNVLSGPSVANYFSEHDITINLCRSSIGALEQLNTLQDFLVKYKHDETDVVYWLVHNPLVNIPAEEIYQDCTSLESGIARQLEKQLTAANDLANKHNILIKLVGASCDLDTVDMSLYNKLLLVVPSWCKLLINEYPTSIFSHTSNHMTELKNSLEKNRPELLEEYYAAGGLAFKKRKCMMKHDKFFDSFHPTSLAHLKLRDYLCSDQAFQLHNTGSNK